ncbi:MAG: hypothetical protein OER43_02950 [Gammaproteobacteria bacterium]|nr:hypothetical protein [Gammaproteobacteria bacterium]MDH3411438.1 hypothetical protein [Gammaproteobacteria bacterium]
MLMRCHPARAAFGGRFSSDFATVSLDTADGGCRVLASGDWSGSLAKALREPGHSIIERVRVSRAR